MIKVYYKGKKERVNINGPKKECSDQIADLVKCMVLTDSSVIYDIMGALAHCYTKQELYDHVDFAYKDCEVLYPNFKELTK